LLMKPLFSNTHSNLIFWFKSHKFPSIICFIWILLILLLYMLLYRSMQIFHHSCFSIIIKTNSFINR
jgi:hypothetical protein